MKPGILIGIVLAIIALGLVLSLAYRQRQFATTQPELSGELAQDGYQVVLSWGCIACHSLDGRAGIGPTWLGMYGRTETLTDGTTVVVDEAYIRESILSPSAKLVEGFDNVMIPYALSTEDVDAIIEFTRQLGNP